VPEVVLISIGVIFTVATFALGVLVGKALNERIRD
jgi:hypothetical protein